MTTALQVAKEAHAAEAVRLRAAVNEGATLDRQLSATDPDCSDWPGLAQARAALYLRIDALRTREADAKARADAALADEAAAQRRARDAQIAEMDRRHHALGQELDAEVTAFRDRLTARVDELHAFVRAADALEERRYHGTRGNPWSCVSLTDVLGGASRRLAFIDASQPGAPGDPRPCPLCGRVSLADGGGRRRFDCPFCGFTVR